MVKGHKGGKQRTNKYQDIQLPAGIAQGELHVASAQVTQL
jgi:hypothetical protein